METSTTGQAPPQMMRRRRPFLTEQRLGWLLVAPSLLLVFGLLGYPLIYSLVIMFMDLNITRPWLGPEFVGLGNFIDMTQNPEFWASLGRTLYFAGASVLFGMPIALTFAVLLNQPFRFRGLARGLMMVPWAIPHVVNSLVWARIYDPNYGNLNGLLYQFGIISSYQAWLTNPNIALLLIVVAEVWVSTPGLTLLLLAGLQTISSDIYEASEVDGASSWQKFVLITMPLIRPMFLVVLVLKTISAFGIFDIIYVLTGGGPANSTQVLGYYIYNVSFKSLNMGYGAALAYVIAIIILVLVAIYARLIKIEGTQEAM